MSEIEDILVTRTLNAPRVKVYDAWVSNDNIIPPVTKHDIDPRVGGKILLTVKGEGGAAIMEGEFSAADRPERLVYTWEWNKCGEVTTVSVDFREVPEGTEVTVSHTGFKSQESHDNHAYGWNSYFDQFAKRL